MKYAEDKWYTVQIKMHDKQDNGEPVVYEFADHNAASLKMFHERIWVQGFRVDLNPGVTWEWIDPLRIHRVIIITQPGKYHYD